MAIPGVTTWEGASHRIRTCIIPFLKRTRLPIASDWLRPLITEVCNSGSPCFAEMGTNYAFRIALP